MRFSGRMPDVTPAQFAAIATFIVTQLVAWDWIDNDTGQILISVGGIILAAAWKIADALIRNGRAKALAANPNLTSP